MAYRRPAIEIIQEFQSAAAALALPSLPACVVGPGFQIKDDINCGTYSETALGSTSFSYVGLVASGVVDLTNTPTAEAEANAHKEVGFDLQAAYLVKIPALPAATNATGVLSTPNVFKDLTGAFAGIDPAATGAPTYYVEVISGAGVAAGDIGRKLVLSKTSSTELVVAADWVSGGMPADVSGVTYRVLEYRAAEAYPQSSYAAKGITKGTASVDVAAGLTSVTDTVAMTVVEATVLLSWRALRVDLAGTLNAFTTLASLEAVFGTGSVVPANIGAYAVNLALLNTTTEVNYTGLGANYWTSESTAFQTALEYLENKDVYGIAILTHDSTTHQTASTHATSMSASSVGRERVVFLNRTLVELEVIVPASGIGTETTGVAPEGFLGTLNKTFNDAGGGFVTDGVLPGQFVEVTSYVAVEGIDRSVVPNERDFFRVAGTLVRMGNATFAAADVAKYIITRGSTTAGNDQEYLISAITSSVLAVVATTAPSASEVMASATRAWICDLVRTPAHHATDKMISGVGKQWFFENGAFTSADIGRILFIQGCTNAGNNGAKIIETVAADGKTITTIETGTTENPLNAGATQILYGVDREPARDYVSDSVDATSRIWTILNAAFTADDVGRKIDITGTIGTTNDGEYTIEAVLSTTQVRTVVADTIAGGDEEFSGLVATLTKLDIEATAPSTSEAAYITGTQHQILTVNSQTSLTMVSDPTSGFGGTLGTVKYRITKNMTLNEQATYLAGYAASFGSRRTVHTVPDILAVSISSVVTKIPGYFAGPILSALTAGLPSQAGFTNMSVTGLIGRENSDDIFSNDQLDTIAGGGNMIFTQLVPDTALVIRHQLTTDLTTIYYQEFSVTKNVDLLARFFRALYLPFLGIYNITDGLLDLLKTRGEGGIAYLLNQRSPRIGAPLRSGQLSRIEESSTTSSAI